MTEQACYTFQAREENREQVSAFISFAAVFVAFAVLSVILCLTVPPLASIAAVPAVTPLSDTDLGKLPYEAFTLSVPQLTVLSVILVGTFSIVSDWVILGTVAYTGFSAGAVIFKALSDTGASGSPFAVIACCILYSAAIIFCAVVCNNSHNRIFREFKCRNRSKAFSESLKLILLNLVIAGGICLISALRLITP